MDFSKRTYLVLEMPTAPWVEQIQNFRERHEPWRRSLPVEITIIGSSGVGVFAEGQDAKKALRTIDRLAAEITPISITFGKRNSFPDSRLYFFEPADRNGLARLQNQIVETGIKFTTSAFPFYPHCTIADLGDAPTLNAMDELNAIALPQGIVTIPALSFYQLGEMTCELVHRSPFKT